MKTIFPADDGGDGLRGGWLEMKQIKKKILPPSPRDCREGKSAVENNNGFIYENELSSRDLGVESGEGVVVKKVFQ